MINRLSFPCPGCKARLRAPLRLIGQSCNCPSCGQAVVVRPSAPEEQGPAFITGEDSWPGQVQPRQRIGA